jgi:cytochrome c biogenesis protein CcmG, thiol:disulfide interchange protein DsbE
MLRRILFLGVFCLGLAWTVLSRPAAGSDLLAPVPQAGFAAPAFGLSDLDGQSVQLADLRGKVVILNFWASWCPPCRAEMPAFQTVYVSYRDQGLIVLGINAANQDTPQAMQAFLESLQPTFPILLDTSGDVNRLYAVEALPTTFFIGRDGTIRDRVAGGPLTVAGLSSRVEPLLREAP